MDASQHGAAAVAILARARGRPPAGLLGLKEFSPLPSFDARKKVFFGCCLIVRN